MSDIRSLSNFSFGEIEKYIKDNLNKVCSHAADNHITNSMEHVECSTMIF
jgi:hypothetical protein